LPFVGYQHIGSGLFQAIGKAKHAIFLAFSRQVLFLIPIVVLFSRYFGLRGVWLSFPTADVVAFTVTAIMVSLELRLLMRMHDKEVASKAMIATTKISHRVFDPSGVITDRV